MANYTEEQKNRIREMPAAVLLNSIIADPGSAIVGMREFMAGEKFISDASVNFPGNALIQDLSKNINLPKMEEVVRPMFSLGDLNAIRTECQRRIRDGLMTLAQDHEADQFKAFLVSLAEKVVNAAGEGFFGTKGQRVSQNEQQYIDSLKQQLSSSMP
jgi:hypothetical protein